jgi:riboflavin kinase / FMN adenylyltransferase
MLVVTDPRSLPPADRAVAIGKFDGLHRGHWSVLRTLMETGLRTTVITFDPHPSTVLGRPVELICSVEQRLATLERAGVHEAVVIEFTPGYARLSPQDWIDLTLTPIGARTVCVGADFRFGHRRAGDVAMLEACGFEVRIAPLIDGASSTTIRGLLREGRTGEAERLMLPRMWAAA